MVFDTLGAINTEVEEILLKQLFRFAAKCLGREFTSYCLGQESRAICNAQCRKRFYHVLMDRSFVM